MSGWPSLSRQGSRPCIVWTALALGSCLVGCKPDSRILACKEDRQQLEAVLQADQQIDRALHAADDAAAKGDGNRAASIVDQQARPAADAALETIGALKARTRWGDARRRFALELLRERKTSMEAYANALRSDELQRVVEQMSLQKTVELKALDLERRIRESAQLSAGDCDSI